MLLRTLVNEPEGVAERGEIAKKGTLQPLESLGIHGQSMVARQHFSVISDISLPDGSRFLVGTGANNTISRGDICNLLLNGHAVAIRVLEIGMRTAERAEKGIDGLLVQIEPGNTASLNGQSLEFFESAALPTSWSDLPLPQALRLNLASARPLSAEQKKRLATLCSAGVESPAPNLYEEIEAIQRENQL